MSTPYITPRQALTAARKNHAAAEKALKLAQFKVIPPLFPDANHDPETARLNLETAHARLKLALTLLQFTKQFTA